MYSPLDLKNQIHLFQNMRNSSIGDIVNLEKFFDSFNQDYTKIKKELKELEGQQNTQNQQAYLQEQLKNLFKVFVSLRIFTPKTMRLVYNN